MIKKSKRVYEEQMVFLDVEEEISPPRGVYRLLFLWAGGCIWVDKDYNEVSEEWSKLLNEYYGRHGQKNKNT